MLAEDSLITPPGRERSYWLQEALADTPITPCPELRERLRVDVCVLGGGYTGLWTALLIRELEPATTVAVLEADICGGGPSGRNGGFVSTMWDEFALLASHFGQEGALRVGHASAGAVEAIGEFCRAHGVDAWFRQAGYIHVASMPGHVGAWRESLEATQHAGLDVLQELSAEEVRQRCDSPAFLGGCYERQAATVQPARLALGLRRVALESGIRIFEGTRARLEGRTPAVVRSAHGEVVADQVVVALNAWAAAWPQVSNKLAAYSSYIALTEPIPQRLAALRWTGGESISDAFIFLHYFRTTPDGRIAFGGRGRLGFDGRIGRRFTHDRAAVERNVAEMHRLFPQLGPVRITHSWGGPIDLSPSHLPFALTLTPGNVHLAAGYTGNGVAPSRMMARVLATLALSRNDEWRTFPLFGEPHGAFPPEPLRFLGGQLIQRAILRRDSKRAVGQRSDPVTSFLAELPDRAGGR